MDKYLKVPELHKSWNEHMPFVPVGGWINLNSKHKVPYAPSAVWLANLINAVYMPDTGLLAQLEVKQKEIEYLRAKVDRLEVSDCSDGCRVEKAVKEFYAE